MEEADTREFALGLEIWEPGRRHLLPGTIRSLLRSKSGVAGGLVVLLYVFVGVAGQSLAPYDPNIPDLPSRLTGISASHPMGTDSLGRDVFSRVIAATRIELQIAIMTAAIAMAIGVPLGLVGAFKGGWVDRLVSFAIDAMMVLPGLVLPMILVGALGPGAVNISISVGLASFPIFARISRARAISLREDVFVDAAKAMGATDTRIIFTHVLPNSTGPLITQAALIMAFAVLVETGLSFVGVGLQPPEPSWGSMVRDGMRFLRSDAYVSIFPGMAIAVFILGFNLLGDGLSDALNPKVAKR